jgi:NAD+ synthase
MPFSETDLKTFNSNSKKCAEHIGVNHQTVSINACATALTNAVADASRSFFPEEISLLNSGNARSRIRMSILYGVAHHLNEKLHNRVRVMGTGNLSEDFIGYDTKGGDALADIFPIGDLLKPEVYMMLEHYRDRGIITEEMINRKPSAGLWEDQTDEDELGISYDEMAPSIQYLQQNYDSIKEETLSSTDLFVWKRHVNNKHKHEAPPVIKVKDARGFFNC